jgi:hypothetical protein
LYYDKRSVAVKEVSFGRGPKYFSQVPVVESSGLDKIRESFETGLKIHPEESY